MAKSRKRRKPPAPPVRPGRGVDNAESVRRLLDAGDIDAARATADRALAERPDDPALLNLAGIAAVRSGDAAAATSLFETALAFDSSFVDARLNLANALAALGRMAEADVAYGRVLAEHPGHADALFNRALGRRAQGRFIEALADLDGVSATHVLAADVAYAKAGIFAALGRLGEAEAAFDMAIARRPEWPDALTDRAALRLERGRDSDARRDLDDALRKDPAHVEARYNRGVLSQSEADPTAAIDAYREVLRHQPGHIGARINLTWAYFEAGRTQDALSESEDTCRRAPGMDKAHVNHADLLRCMGRFDESIDAARAFLTRQPGNPSMTAFLAVAEAAAGNAEAAARILGLKDMIRTAEVDWTAYGVGSDFDDRLADHVLNHPSFHDSPRSHATRMGGHTGNLMVEPLGPMDTFAAAIGDAVEQAWTEIAACRHPSAVRPLPPKTGIHAWAVAMRNGGHQKPHNHPSAWLSGVYYVAVPGLAAGEPDDVTVDSGGAERADRTGWIEFGRPPDTFAGASVPNVRLIRPRQGAVIVFPSYLFHRTIPHASDDLRISIAFDIVDAS